MQPTIKKKSVTVITKFLGSTDTTSGTFPFEIERPNYCSRTIKSYGADLDSTSLHKVNRKLSGKSLLSNKESSRLPDSVKSK
jgi:hypothetical protein